MKQKNLVYALVIVSVMAILFSMFMGGCISVPKAPSIVPHRVIPALQPFDNTLTVVSFWSLLAIIVSLIAFFELPAAHRASGMTAIGGGISLILCLILKTALPFIPYIAGLAVVTGLAFVVYEVIYHIRHGEFDKPGGGKGNL